MRRRAWGAALLVVALLSLQVATGCGSSGGDDAGSTLDSASLDAFETGRIDLMLGSEPARGNNGALLTRVDGPVDLSEDVPATALTATIHGDLAGEEVDIDGGMVLLPEKAFIQGKEGTFDLSSSFYSLINLIMFGSPTAPSDPASAKTCRSVAEKAGFAPSEFMTDLHETGTTDMDGVSVQVFEGGVDLPVAFDSLDALLSHPDCRAHFEALGPLVSRVDLEQAIEDLRDNARDGTATIAIDDDGLVRRSVIELTTTPTPASGVKGDVDVSLEMLVTAVGEEQRMRAPENAKPVEAYFRESGKTPAGLIREVEGFVNDYAAVFGISKLVETQRR